MNSTTEKLLAGLKDYSIEWENVLNDTFEKIDFDLYSTRIKQEYNKVLTKLPESDIEYIKPILNRTLKNILLLIKEKELELESFNAKVDITGLLAEDTLELELRNKDVLFKELQGIIEPRLKHTNKLNESKDKYTFINNSLYYRKKYAKELSTIITKLERVNTVIDPDFESMYCTIIRHISFLSTSDNPRDIVSFVLNNLDLYIAHDDYLECTYAKIQATLVDSSTS